MVGIGFNMKEGLGSDRTGEGTKVEGEVPVT